jgi:hypothetical protein
MFGSLFSGLECGNGAPALAAESPRPRFEAPGLGAAELSEKCVVAPRGAALQALRIFPSSCPYCPINELFSFADLGRPQRTIRNHLPLSGRLRALPTLTAMVIGEGVQKAEAAFMVADAPAHRPSLSTPPLFKMELPGSTATSGAIAQIERPPRDGLLFVQATARARRFGGWQRRRLPSAPRRASPRSGSVRLDAKTARRFAASLSFDHRSVRLLDMAARAVSIKQRTAVAVTCNLGLQPGEQCRIARELQR